MTELTPAGGIVLVIILAAVGLWRRDVMERLLRDENHSD